jgi:hypothetical protein
MIALVDAMGYLATARFSALKLLFHFLGKMKKKDICNFETQHHHISVKFIGD